MTCPWCHSADTFPYYRAEMPTQLAACDPAHLKRVQSYPFEARLCRCCLLGWNATPLTGEQLAEIYDDYGYISPLDGFGTEKYEGMLDTARRHFGADDALIEIGACDGYLISRLKDCGYTKLLGLEPSAPQVERARALGLPVKQGYFDRDTFPRCLRVNGFVLMHVFEHFSEPWTALAIMARHLAEDGKIVIEVPHMDGHHHQHLFFYNPIFLRRLCHSLGLGIIDAFVSPTILRVVLQRGPDAVQFETTAEDVIRQAEERYITFNRNVALLREMFAASDEPIYWYGAGSSSVIYLNQLGIEAQHAIVVDGDPHKAGKVIPGVNRRVLHRSAIAGRNVGTLVIASEFHEAIKRDCAAQGTTWERCEVVI